MRAIPNGYLSRAAARRTRRKKRRGKLTPAVATRISVRTRALWPRTMSVTRVHPARPRWAEKM